MEWVSPAVLKAYLWQVRHDFAPTLQKFPTISVENLFSQRAHSVEKSYSIAEILY